MRKARNPFVMIAVSLALAFVSCAVAFAQDEEAPVKIILTPGKTSFEPTEPIKLQVRVYNAEMDEVITREGFFGQNFYTLITFTDPDGLPVRNVFKDETDDPGPPDTLGGRPAAAVEADCPASGRRPDHRPRRCPGVLPSGEIRLVHGPGAGAHGDLLRL